MKLSSKLIPRKFCSTTLVVGGDDGTERGIVGDAARQPRGSRKARSMVVLKRSMEII